MASSNADGEGHGARHGTSLASRLSSAHDAVTAASFQLAVMCLGIISVAFCYEVVARYAFNAPTVWANPLVSYLLCAMIFLALPELTRTSQHISINILIGALSAPIAALLQQVIRAIGLVACIFAAWITAGETGAQITGNIWTISYFPVPKWLISIFIPYGLLSAALYFLRQIAGDRASPIEETGA